MKKLIYIALITTFFPFSSLAEDKSCFPIGRARHDRECYDMDSEKSCLKQDDIYSCGWGKRAKNAPTDDELLVCDNARCTNGLDGDDENLEDHSNEQ